MGIAFLDTAMGTTAITVWDSIVSPLYDAAERIMFVHSDGTRECVDVSRMSMYGKAEFLAENKTRVLICGAISEIAQAVLAEKGIRVHPWVRGMVEDVLRAHSRGALDSAPFLMPGCQERGRCRRNRCRGEGRRHGRSDKS